MKKILDSKQVRDYANENLGLNIPVSCTISKSQQEIIEKEIEVKAEFEDSEKNSRVETAWHNGKLIAVCDIYEGEGQYMPVEKYDELVDTLISEGYKR